jgi:hypothetical protein
MIFHSDTTGAIAVIYQTSPRRVSPRPVASAAPFLDIRDENTPLIFLVLPMESAAPLRNRGLAVGTAGPGRSGIWPCLNRLLLGQLRDTVEATSDLCRV